MTNQEMADRMAKMADEAQAIMDDGIFLSDREMWWRMGEVLNQILRAKHAALYNVENGKP